MRALGAIVAATCCLILSGCGSSRSKPAETAADVPAKRIQSSKHRQLAQRSHEDSTPAQQPAPRAELPQQCTGSGKECFPPEDFVSLLCQKKYPGVAIKMFEKSAPWQRGFIKIKDVAPVNSHGGPTASTRLEFLEEIVVLRMRPNKYREMVADMPNSFDVLRFDGTCATLAEDEFMTRKPALPPRYAPFVWSQIDPTIRRALSKEPKVEKARLDQTELCRGTILTGGSGACKDATQKLARAILAAISQGATLPEPDELPDWPRVSEATARIDRTIQ